MRIVLDENVPLPLKAAFGATATVTTVQESGLAGIANGGLISALEGQAEVFITADKQLKYQQNLTGRSLAIIELPTNRLPRLRPIFAAIVAAAEKAAPGSYTEVQEQS